MSIRPSAESRLWRDHRILRIVAARILRPYVLDLTFNNGIRKVVDMQSELWGETHEPLKNPHYFMQGSLDRDAGTVTWPNGADLAPEAFFELPPAPEVDIAHPSIPIAANPATTAA